MPLIHVKRTITVDAPIEKVYETISDLSSWAIWSPWLIMDPEAYVNISDDLKYYDWKGSRVGSGNMNISAENGTNTVNYDLNFIKPWKSKAKVKMDLKSSGQKTEVNWYMESIMPWFMFWMKNMMVKFISMDFDRGLLLLKDYVEDGKVHSKLNFIGEGEYPGCNYIGITRSCSIEDMASHEKSDFENLMAYSVPNDDLLHLEAFCIYHKFDIKRGLVKYTAGVPYRHLPSELSTEYITGSIPATKTYTIEHLGPYHHLGNTWTTFQNMIRSKEIKIDEKIPPFETFVNSPKFTAPKDLITRVHFAIK